MKEIKGANMDVDFFPADGVDWEVGKCPWNEADGEDCHKCAVKGVSICKYFNGIKKLDTVLCSYGENDDFKKMLSELDELGLDRDSYAVFGSGPMAIRGIRDAGDLDIIVRADAWDELRKKYPIGDVGSIEVGDVEIWGSWFEVDDVEELIDEADIIDGYRFVKLERVAEWKKADKRNRDKDKRDIDLIKEYMARENGI